MNEKFITLNVTSPFEVELPRSIGTKLWKDFLSGAESRHSLQACTLPYLMRRAEREKMPYVLTSYPGEGYTLQRLTLNRLNAHLKAGELPAFAKGESQ